MGRPEHARHQCAGSRAIRQTREPQGLVNQARAQFPVNRFNRCTARRCNVFSFSKDFRLCPGPAGGFEHSGLILDWNFRREYVCDVNRACRKNDPSIMS
jgi:hypothetical protein